MFKTRLNVMIFYTPKTPKWLLLFSHLSHVCNKLQPSYTTLFDYPNNILSPWSRVLLEKLIVTQLVEKFPPFL